jgi:hypothetical protein
MYAGIGLLVYMAYLFLGINYVFSVAWLDWQAPYAHYAILKPEAAMPAFVLPGVLLLFAAFNWYRASNRNEA